MLPVGRKIKMEIPVKILLINPNNPYNVYRVPRFIQGAPVLSRYFDMGARSVFPPLHLATLAAYCQPDAEVRIIDECIEPVDFEADADLVGITAMTCLAPVAYRIADSFRERGKTVVLGGIHPTLLPEEAADHADAVAVGEGEMVWPGIMEDFRQGRLKRIYRANGFLRMENLRWPRRDLLAPRGYLLQTVQSSRGCPYDCDFCSVTTTLGRALRYRPVSEVAEEIRTLPSRYFFFIDDNICGSRRRARALFRALIPLKLGWGGQATAGLADDEELLDLAAESGCKVLFLGFETFSNQHLKKLGTHEKWQDKFFQTVRKIHARGVAIWGAFVIGFDGDTPGTIAETVRRAQEADLDFAQFSTLTPLPGTRLYADYRREGRIFNHDWAAYSLGEVVFRPALMDVATLKKTAYEAWREFYCLRSIYRRLPLWPLRQREFILWLINLGIRKVVKGAQGWSAPRVPDHPLAQIEINADYT
jgi:radical SAM superfamily enzyme YgiQ (UPF0313 family)